MGDDKKQKELVQKMRDFVLYIFQCLLDRGVPEGQELVARPGAEAVQRNGRQCYEFVVEMEIGELTGVFKSGLVLTSVSGVKAASEVFKIVYQRLLRESVDASRTAHDEREGAQVYDFASKKAIKVNGNGTVH